MTVETNIKLKVIEHNGPHRGDNIIEPYCRVKVDGQGFPYIAVHNEKFVISSYEFPQKLGLYGDHWATIEQCIEGLDELEKLLSNPDLTVDKLGAKQRFRVSHA